MKFSLLPFFFFYIGLAFTPVSAIELPKLVVTIVVDQMRYDYWERSQHLFSTNGFRLLLDRGAFMTAAKYNYFPTITGPGHASYLSGCGPAVHGIVGNDWFDRRTGKDIYCCADTNVTAVGTTNKSQMSPRNFIGATVGDQMRLHYNSKVIGISLKDRAAILPAGKKPKGAFWFDSKIASFITSSYYMTNLPSWVTEFNDRKLPQTFAGKAWDRLFDAKEYLFDDDAPGEGRLSRETNSVFSHKIRVSTNNVDAVLQSPFGDELLTEFAIAAIDAEGLGQGERPDMLCLSFSSTDMVGHTFGPHSHEIQDLTFRLDRQFEKLFNHIDRKVGLGNTIIVVTADHAVAPTPEFASSMGLDGHRWDSGRFVTNLQKRLETNFGAGKYFQVNKLSNGGLFLNHDTLREKGLESGKVSNLIREFAFDTGLFQACFTREQLLNGNAPGWIGAAVLNGFNAERGADLILIGKPFGLAATGKTGTTHGSPFSYDTRVPILFFGRAFKAGRYADEFYITDIAATLSAVLRITEPPGSFGKVAVRILAE
jgi:predicted AlkP superfamily pyrophosphatase or phosphodiesterase